MLLPFLIQTPCNTDTSIYYNSLGFAFRIHLANVILESLSKDVYERRTPTGNGRFAILGSGLDKFSGKYLTIIPRDQMGSESIAHEAQDRMGY